MLFGMNKFAKKFTKNKLKRNFKKKIQIVLYYKFIWL